MRNLKEIRSLRERNAKDYKKEKDPDSEAKDWEPRTDGEKKFVKKHKVTKRDHPTGTDDQFKSNDTDPVKTKNRSSDVGGEMNPPKQGGSKSYMDVRKKIKEGVQIEEKADTSLETILKAAHPFGGSAQKDQYNLLKKIEKQGYISIDSRDPLDGSYDYTLTAKGKSKLKSIKESIELEEAISSGEMKLNDGSKVNISSSDAKAINDVLNDLNPSNRSRMESEMKKDKKSFEKILQFAKSQD